MKYDQIFIKSKADWPKVKGTYFCNRSGFKTVMELDPDLPEKSYMREIRWYLQPVQVTEEEYCRALGDKGHGKYPLIPMTEITDEAREIAVAWMECDDKDWIGQKHKLASDIMNYAKKHAQINTDLLEALKSITEYWDAKQPNASLYTHISHSLKIAEAAIKKATQ